MSKNPFEIRLETLKMAKEMMDQAYDSQIQQMHMAAEIMKEEGKPYQQFLSEYAPKMYNPSEIVSKATELYEYIQKKS
jgi:hypothetical protein